MVAAGIPVERIAPCLGTKGMTKRTLYKHFRHELATGQDYIHGRAAGRLLQAVDKGEAWAICFLLKTRYGWRERDSVDHRFVDSQGRDRNVLLTELDRLVIEADALPLKIATLN